MSVAVVQGASGGLGFALTRHILQHTSLKVYALTHQSPPDDLHSRISEGPERDRLVVLDQIDVRQERGLEDAARTIGEREGRGSVRLIACLAGILHPEKSLSSVNAQAALDSFRINTLGHLLTYKHLVPLVPSKREFEKLRSTWSGQSSSDPARGLVGPGNSLCFSLSARVGSIADNQQGGWYSYRASKAALNQVIRTLDHELINRSSSALAIAYHPGTVLTSFTSPFLGDNAQPNPTKGRLSVDGAIGHMTKLMGSATRERDGWGGRCWDWRGERVEW